MRMPEQNPASLEQSSLQTPPRIVRLDQGAGVERRQRRFDIEEWNPDDVDAIFNLEKSTWPPWLCKPLERIRTIANNPIKRKTHLIAKDRTTHKIVGIMSATRTEWDGNPDSLLPWDAYAGGPVWDGNIESLSPKDGHIGGSVAKSDYPDYQKNGNTLVIMSSSVHPDYRSQGVVRELLEELKDRANAKNSGIERMVGPFRPSAYGEYKLNPKNPQIRFDEYCNKVIANELIDPWLQAAIHMGMIPRRVEDYSMSVSVPIETFEIYKKIYKPDKWKKMPNGTWECDEAGSWIIVDSQNNPAAAFAVYIEPNLLGEIPLLTSVPER